jgi:acetate kinase
MPPKAYMFGLPYEDYEELHVRKYGFHGTSHRFVSAALAKAMGKDIKDLKIVSCHLGNGSSITAVDGGKSVDTTMGFTPLDGVIMGTRSGCVDASAVTFVADKRGLTPSQMSDYLNKKSGFIGISGVSSDNRDIIAGANEGNKRCELVNDMLTYEIKKYIGAFAAAMNGLDAVLFTGGIGENESLVRSMACSDMDFLGIKLDEEVNKSIRGKLCKISAADSKVEVWIVPTNEELLIARDTLALVNK